MTVATERVTQAQVAQDEKSTFGFSTNLRPFDYLTWKQLQKLSLPATNAHLYKNNYNAEDLYNKGGATEAFCLKAISFLDIEDVKLSPRSSQLDAYLKIDLVVRLKHGVSIGLQVKSSRVKKVKYDAEYKNKRVFYYTDQGEKREFYAPSCVWVNVAEVKPLQFVLFLSHKLGIPVSSSTKQLVDKYSLLKRLFHNNRVAIQDRMFATLKITNDELYLLSFLKLVTIKGGTIHLL